MVNAVLKQISKKILVAVVAVFLLANVLAAFHAYKFTHFSAKGVKMEKK